MDYDKNYPIPFKNYTYFRTLEEVNELLKISKYCGSNIEITICTKGGERVTGIVKYFRGHNPLYPADVYIPIIFQIETNDGLRELNFLEVDSIKIKG